MQTKMKSQSVTLTKMTEGEDKLIRSTYFNPDDVWPYADDIRLGLSENVTERPENTWHCVAVKLKPGLSEENILQVAVSLKAGEYSGKTKNGYHLFWYD